MFSKSLALRFFRLLNIRLCGLGAFFRLRQATAAAIAFFFIGHIYHLLSVPASYVNIIVI